jgi:hypothetical protein
MWLMNIFLGMGSKAHSQEDSISLTLLIGVIMAFGGLILSEKEKNAITK